jgi:sporulation-control protein
MFKKALAKLGIGSATVDTILERSTYRQGERVRGQIHIRGGKAAQEIDDIYLYLVVQYYHEGTEAECVVDEFRLTERFVVSPFESQVIPFEFTLPLDTPVSTGGSPVYLKTGLDIKRAIDPTDLDGIEVLPHPAVDQILKAVESLGFRLYQVQYDFEHFHSRNPFVQVYNLKPTGDYSKQLDKLSFIFNLQNKRIDVVMKVDRKPIHLLGKMEEQLKLDERITQFSVTQHETNHFLLLRERIEKILQQQLT